MQYTGLGLTEESTWEEIISVLTEYFPDSYYLYNSGDNCKIITGGYVASGAYTSYSENTGDCLYFYSLRLSTNASGNYGYLRTKNKIEVKSEHTALKCHVKSASQSYAKIFISLVLEVSEVPT